MGMQCGACYFLMIFVHLAALPEKCLQQPCVPENNYVSVQSSHTVCPVIWFMCPEESSQAPPVKKVEAPVAATVEDKEDAANMENTPPVVEPPSKPKYR